MSPHLEGDKSIRYVLLFDSLRCLLFNWHHSQSAGVCFAPWSSQTGMEPTHGTKISFTATAANGYGQGNLTAFSKGIMSKSSRLYTVSMSWTAPDSFLRLRFLATIPSSDLRSSQFPFIPALMCYESSQHNTLNKITFSQTQFNDSCMWHLHLESLQFMSTSKSAKVQSMQMIPSLFRRSCSCWYCFLAVVSY